MKITSQSTVGVDVGTGDFPALSSKGSGTTDMQTMSDFIVWIYFYCLQSSRCASCTFLLLHLKIEGQRTSLRRERGHFNSVIQFLYPELLVSLK